MPARQGESYGLICRVSSHNVSKQIVLLVVVRTLPQANVESNQACLLYICGLQEGVRRFNILGP